MRGPEWDRATDTALAWGPNRLRTCRLAREAPETSLRHCGRRPWKRSQRARREREAVALPFPCRSLAASLPRPSDRREPTPAAAPRIARDSVSPPALAARRAGGPRF